MKNLKNQFLRKNEAKGFIFPRKLIFQVFHLEKIEIFHFLPRNQPSRQKLAQTARDAAATSQKLRLLSFKQV
jgi:hypothetical protein